MKLEKALLYDHAKRNAQRIQRYIGNNPARYAEVVNLYLQNHGLLSQRAIWVLSLSTEVYPHLALPHLTLLLRSLTKNETDNASKRNIVRLLQFIDIPEKFQSNVINLCFRYLKDPKEQISVRIFSMTVLTNLCHKISEIKTELLLVLENQLPYASAGFISRAKKSIRQLTW